MVSANKPVCLQLESTLPPLETSCLHLLTDPDKYKAVLPWAYFVQPAVTKHPALHVVSPPRICQMFGFSKESLFLVDRAWFPNLKIKINNSA